MSKQRSKVGFILLFTSSFFFMAFCEQTSTASKSWEAAIAPEFHFDQDLHTFYLQKDSTFKNRYFIEWTSGAELAFVSINKKFFLFIDMTVTVGLGKWAQADKPILFDPREVDVGFGPKFEYRFSPVNVNFGLDHHCFHQIDSDPTASTAQQFQKVMYWNKLTLNVMSKQFRHEEFRHAIADSNKLTWKRRIGWQAGITYSLHDFFGMDTSILSWNQPYLIDCIGQVRFAACRYKGWAAVFNATTGAYYERTNDMRWNQQMGVELLSTQGVFGLDLFVNWVVLDQLAPRQNKDGLLAVGINGFN